MGLLDMLGYGNNPFYKAFDANRGKISGAFSGMVGAGNDPRMALQGFVGGLQHGQSVDQENAIIAQKKAEQEAAAKAEQDKQSATIKWLQDKGYGDLVAAVNGGMPIASAWNEGLTRANAKPPGPIKASEGDVFLDPNTYKPVASVPKQPALPAGMVMGPDGTQIAPPGSKEAFDREQALNQQYASTDPVKTYQVVRNGYEKIRTASQAGNGPGDVSMIFAYMKMLDPTSVVREGEFATAQNAGGVGATVSNLYNSVLNGQKLTPELRQQFLAEADKMYKEAAANLEAENKLYGGRAQPWGVDPSHFLVNPESYPPLNPGQTITMPDGTTIKALP